MVNSNLLVGGGCKMHWIYYIFTHVLDICEPLIRKLVNMDLTLENSIPISLGKFS